jgi:hypothetical protein
MTRCCKELTMENVLKSCARDEEKKGEPTVIEGNLMMESNMVFEGDLTVKGSILGKGGKLQDLKVKGDLFVMNGNVVASIVEVGGDIIVNNMNAWSVRARNIIANCVETIRDTGADNMSVFSLICNGLDLKKGGDLIAHIVVTDRDSCEKKNWANGAKSDRAYVR